jgi:magnesium transporter
MTETEALAAPVSRLGELRAALESGTLRNVRRMIHSMHPAEIASLLEALPPAQRELVWEMVDPDDDGEVLLHVNDEVRGGLIRGMDAEELLAATEGLEVDDLADLFADLPETCTRQVLRSMDQQNRERLQQVLAFEADTAGGLMNTDTVTVRPDVTLDVVLRYLRMRDEMPPHTDRLFVVDRYGRVLGTIALTKLLVTDESATVAEVMDGEVATIQADLPAVEVAKLFGDRDLVSAPVVDAEGHLLGRITIDDVVDVIRGEADHTVMSMAGLDESEDMFAPVLEQARRRAVWIAINLFTAVLAAGVVGLFADTLERLVALAVLMPIVASMGGIAGSQVLTLMVRGFALGQVEAANAPWVLTRQLAVVGLNALLAALVMFLVVMLWAHDRGLASVIAIALVVNLCMAAIAGVTIPLLLRRLDVDPALAGPVLVTTVTDVIGFLTFLGLGTLFLL